MNQKRNPSENGLSRPRASAVLLGVLLAAGCGMTAPEDALAPVEAGPWAAQVTAVTYGGDATFGQNSMPDVVLGPSSGSGTGTQSLDVVSLGSGGSITVAFAPDGCAVDGDGDDLAVLENVFFVAGDEDNRFVEAGRVEVSQDGRIFFEFPASVEKARPLGDPLRYEGFAGVEPVHAGELPGGVGGDRFDLADLGLGWVRYVRITDVNGDPEDPGDIMSVGYGMNGFDLDAVGAIHYGQGDACL